MVIGHLGFDLVGGHRLEDGLVADHRRQRDLAGGEVFLDVAFLRRFHPKCAGHAGEFGDMGLVIALEFRDLGLGGGIFQLADRRIVCRDGLEDQKVLNEFAEARLGSNCCDHFLFLCAEVQVQAAAWKRVPASQA